jgi:hypothetical protein
MKPQAWAVIALAAIVGPVAWRFARRSRLALAIALVATTVAGLGVAFGAFGYGGCAQRGDCGTVGGALRTVLTVAILALAALLLFAPARALWRRLVPRRARARGDAPRMRRRDIALAICGAVMALSSIAVIASNRAEDRPGGLAVVLFSAGILCVPLAGRLATRNRLLPRLDRIEHDGALQRALVLPGSLVKLRLMRIGCLCFAGAGVVMAIWPLESSTRSVGEVRFVGIGCAALFGAIGLAGTLLARGPVRIELLPDALRWQTGAAACSVAWQDITDVRVFEIRSTWFLAIDARPGSVRMPRGQRLLARANRAVSRADVSISLEAFPVQPDRLAEAIAACAHDAGRRRQIGTERSLAWLTDPAAPAPAMKLGSTRSEHAVTGCGSSSRCSQQAVEPATDIALGDVATAHDEAQ